MNNKVMRGIVAAAAIAALALGGAAIAGATGGGDDDATEKPITGQALERAKAAALDHVGSGSVTGTEVDDEEGAYEVEVTDTDGRQFDVHLDEDFGVISQVGDSDEGPDDDK